MSETESDPRHQMVDELVCSIGMAAVLSGLIARLDDLTRGYGPEEYVLRLRRDLFAALLAYQDRYGKDGGEEHADD